MKSLSKQIDLYDYVGSNMIPIDVFKLLENEKKTWLNLSQLRNKKIHIISRKYAYKPILDSITSQYGIVFNGSIEKSDIVVIVNSKNNTNIGDILSVPVLNKKEKDKYKRIFKAVKSGKKYQWIDEANLIALETINKNKVDQVDYAIDIISCDVTYNLYLSWYIIRYRYRYKFKCTEAVLNILRSYQYLLQYMMHARNIHNDDIYRFSEVNFTKPEFYRSALAEFIPPSHVARILIAIGEKPDYDIFKYHNYGLKIKEEWNSLQGNQ